MMMIVMNSESAGGTEMRYSEGTTRRAGKGHENRRGKRVSGKGEKGVMDRSY